MRRASARTARTRLLVALLLLPAYLLLNALLLLPAGAQDLDLGNGYAHRVLRDANGDAYDLADVYPLPATVAHNEYLAQLARTRAARPAPPAGVEGLIGDAARRWGNDPQRMLRIAWCESKYQPGATSRGGHRGIFQFDGATWRERAALIGVSADFAAAYDPQANVEVAAATMAAGQWWRWACR